MRSIVCGALISATFAATCGASDPANPPRGLAVRAEAPVVIDGRLAEWDRAFCTPVHYNHRQVADRAAQFFYQWDEAALYVGLRCLDRHRADPGDDGSVWDGDAVEFYLDTRPGPALRGRDWTPGAVHLFYSAFKGDAIGPRWMMRGGIPTSDPPLRGVRVAGSAHPWGYECEVAIPWANFPGFEPKAGATIALDAELCSGDGGGRTDRTFAYGSPLSVQQPASQAAVRLVEPGAEIPPSALPATFPMWVDTPWVQAGRAEVTAVVAIPPAMIGKVSAVEVRLHDPDGRVVRTLPAAISRFGDPAPGFARAEASWSIDDAAPGAYFATAKVTGPAGLDARVTPRMVQEANMTGR